MGIVEFLAAQYDRIEKAARAAGSEGEVKDGRWFDDGYEDVDDDSAWRMAFVPSPGARAHVALHDPAYVLADIESKRQIIREVMSWRHEVVDGDCWFTCGAATEERDGGECCNDNQRNECTCGLDDRREKILSLLAAPFSAEPGYDAERWAV